MSWLRIILFSVAAGVLSFAAASYSYSRYSPSPMHKVAALASGIAPLQYADKRMPADMRGVKTLTLVRLARESLKKDPINPRGVRMLGLDAWVKKKREDVVIYAKLSSKLSRRDGTTNLLLIDALAVNPETQISDILNLYDITLRVKPQLSEQLYPALIRVLAAPDAQREIAPYIKKQSPWIAGFMHSAMSAEHGPAAIARAMLLSSPKERITTPKNFSSDTIFNGLFAKQEYALMKQLFLKMAGTNPQWLSSMDTKLSQMQNKYGPMVWQFRGSSDMSVLLVQSENGDKASFSVTAVSGSRGIPVRRLFFPADGKFEFRQRHKFLVGDDSSAYWRFKCAKTQDSSVIKDVTLSRSELSIETISFNSANCVGYIAELHVAAGSGQVGAEFLIEEPSFSRKR